MISVLLAVFVCLLAANAIVASIILYLAFTPEA